LINVYLDSSQSALKYLKDTEVNINNVLIITEDFNIRDSFWDPYFPYHSTYRDSLFDIADSFQLEISKPTEFFPIRYSDNDQDSNSVLDLIFLWLFSTEFNNYHIHPDWRLMSRSLTVDFIHFYFLVFYFSLSFIFYFLFLEQLRLGVICHAVTSVTNWWCNHKTDHKT